MNGLSDNSTSLLLFLMVALFLIPFVFYLITLQKTLKAISPENRKMQPYLVWLLFIPIVGIIWHFIIVSKLSDSIKAESFIREIELKEARPGYGIGFAMCILNCVSLFSQLFGVVSAIAALGFLICWIIYWAKIAWYKKEISNSTIIKLDAESELESI